MSGLLLASLTATAAFSLPEVVVTAHRAPRSVLATTRTLHTITEDTLHERVGQSTPDALEGVPGVLMQRTNRGAGAPLMRGRVGPDNLLVFDGIRLNNSTYRTGPNQYLALIDPSSVSRLEVLLGPGAVLYGSGAMGGVVQAMFAEPDRDSGVGARLRLTADTVDSSAGVQGRATYDRGDQAVQIGGAYRAFGPLRGGRGTTHLLSDYGTDHWHARVVQRLGRSQLRLTALGTQIHDAPRTDRLLQRRLRFYDNQDHLVYADWLYDGDGWLDSLRVSGSLHRTQETVERFRCSTGPVSCALSAAATRDTGRTASTITTRRVNEDQVYSPGWLVRANLKFADGRVRLTAGSEGSVDLVSSSAVDPQSPDTPRRGNFSEGSRYLQGAVFSLVDLDLWKSGDHQLTVTGGVRGTLVQATAPEVPGLGEVSYDFAGVSGSAGLVYILDRWSIYTNVAQGFRAPNLQETTALGDTGSKFEVPNGDLGPERTLGFELGARHVSRRFSLHAAVFVTRARDLIDERTLDDEQARAFGAPDGLDQPVVQRVNARAGLHYGFEASGRARLSIARPWFRVSWIRGTVETDAGQTPARRVPPLMAAVGVDWRFTSWLYLEPYIELATRQDKLHPSDEADLRICGDPANPGRTFSARDQACPGTAGWLTTNVRLGAEVTDAISLNATVTNLSDTRYRWHGSGIDAPGRSFAVSLAGRY